MLGSAVQVRLTLPNFLADRAEPGMRRDVTRNTEAQITASAETLSSVSCSPKATAPIKAPATGTAKFTCAMRVAPNVTTTESELDRFLDAAAGLA